MEDIAPQPQQVAPPPHPRHRVMWLLDLLLVLIALISAFNFYQIAGLKQDMNEVKTQVGKIEPIYITPTPTSVTKTETLDLTGTIQYNDVEGGCWAIRADSPQCQGEKCSLGLAAPYEPVNLPDALKKIGVKAKFKLEVLPDTATICQLGPAVKIMDYRIVK